MAQFRSEALRLLDARRALHQVSEGTDAALAHGRRVFYIGYDCTGPSAHVGHLMSIMTMRRLQQCGHKPIVVMGGGTTKVGDPSGKDESRQLLSAAQIEANKQSILKIFQRFLTFGEGPSDAIMVDNAEWLDALDYIPFLREIGRHFTINRMLTFDSVKLRLEREQPLTFLEFNYMILQAYDFLELHRRYGCTLQAGGSDQWGNIVNGIELARRVDNAELHALTTPLLTTASGAKMGKTASGAVWLNAEKLSPYDYWQYWRNTEDADVGPFLRLFTELPDNEIVRLESLEGQEINEAKKVLAGETTALAHGIEAAAQAEETARHTFEEGILSEGLPTVAISKEKFPMGVLTLAVEAGLSASNSAARQLIANNGLKLDGTPVTDPKLIVHGTDPTHTLSLGRKKHVLIKIV